MIPALAAAFVLALASGVAGGAPAPRVLVFDLGARDLADFERNAALASRLGATHLVVTGYLPPATWQMQPPGEPYPAWFINQPDFAKIFPPAELKPYVDADYAEEVAKILEERCRILRKFGLKAYWSANAPQVWPEAFFVEHPELRGPRVDQPNRSRNAFFAPCVDQPETIRLFGEAMRNLLARCPEVDTFSFLTTDSGSGFCWVPGLYPGANGPAWCRERPMAERVAGWLASLQQAAAQAGHAVSIEIHQIEPRQWMIPSFGSPMEIVRKLPAGLALNNREGPDGRSFMRSRGASAWRMPFRPVVGVAVPSLMAERDGGESAREFVSFGDPAVQADNLRLYEATRAGAPRNEIARLTLLRRTAAEEVGEALADDVLEMWTALGDVDRRLDSVNFGPMFLMGHLLARWINRPLVPFPAELPAEDKSYYRPFLFQAKGEEQADNLADIQAMRMYEGWGAKMIFQRVIETALPRAREAARLARRVRDGLEDPAKRARWDTLSRRIEAVGCLLEGADHAVAYQAYLDRARQLGAKPEANPPLGALNSWERADIMQIARAEIDNAVRLRQLLLGSKEPIIETAATPAGETIMALSPALADQIKRKIDIMNRHWRDYDRLFTAPNP